MQKRPAVTEAAMPLLRNALFAALALALLAGCGDNADTTAAALAEQARQASNSEGEVDDGAHVISFQTEDGTLRRSEGDDVALPEDFPDDIRLPDDYTLVSVMTMGPTVSLVMQSEQAVPRLYDDFQNRQVGQGWTETLTMKGTGGWMLGFEKGKRGLLVNLSSDVDGKSVVSLSVQAR